MNIVIASNKSWGIDVVSELEKNGLCNVSIISSKEALTSENLNELSPKYVFFPHWSYLIPKEIFQQFECVIFHMTDLPYGRGGSPLQNLISRKIYDTKVTAIRCEEGIDTGPIYLQKPLSLFGGAEEIYIRACKIIAEMIIDIVKSDIKPTPQQGAVVEFQRRKPEDGCIRNLETLEEVFDYIRMLDAKEYPPAYIDLGKFRYEFSRPTLRIDGVYADVKISTRKELKNEQESSSGSRPS